MVLKGKIRAAVRFATLMGEGETLKATYMDSETGKPVLEMLQSETSSRNSASGGAG